MKVVVFSDVHGNKQAVDRILDFNPDADYVISLGDSELEHDYLLNHDIVHVKGNMSRDPGFVYESDLLVGDLKIFLTHGHKFKVHRTLDKLYKHGVANGYDIVLFGHTHIIYQDKMSKTLFVNPGSCASPRDMGAPPSYAILNIEGKTVTVTFKNANTNDTMEIL